MKNKKLIYIVLGVIILGILSFLIFNKNDSKLFYLDSKYYNNGEFIQVDSLNNLKNDTYLLYTYGDFCIFNTPCEDIFKSVMDEYKIDIVKMHYDNFKNTKYHNKVRYAPSVLIIKNGKLIAYLDTEKDEDLNRYQDSLEFKNWLNKYIYLK